MTLEELISTNNKKKLIKDINYIRSKIYKLDEEITNIKNETKQIIEPISLLLDQHEILLDYYFILLRRAELHNIDTSKYAIKGG